MKFVVIAICVNAIWLTYLTLWLREVSLENQKQDDAMTQIRNNVSSFVKVEKNEKAPNRKRDYIPNNDNNDIIDKNPSLVETARRKKTDIESQTYSMGTGSPSLQSHSRSTSSNIIVERKRNIENLHADLATDIHTSLAVHNRRAMKVREDYNSSGLSNEMLINGDETYDSATTTCILQRKNINNNEMGLNANSRVDDTATYYDKTFQLLFNLMTDKLFSFGLDWSLRQIHDDESSLVIDSKNNDDAISLLSNKLHEFEYRCFVNSQSTKKKEICYDFRIYDTNYQDYGLCCQHGVGYLKLSINQSPISFGGTNRLHGKELSTIFCINSEDGTLIQKEEETKNEDKNSLYPSRQCKNQECLCDVDPILFTGVHNDVLYDTKMKVMTQMILLSGSEKLIDVTTPQYKAACWVLLDDPYEYNQENLDSALNKNIEERMIQRYIVASLYFATNKLEGWKDHYHFLSQMSECMWNDMDEFYANKKDKISGCVCDENENVISIFLNDNNLNGELIDELYGLTKLEKIYIRSNRDLQGTIPSSFGRIPMLQYLKLVRNSLQGTIPPELFNATKLQYIDLGINAFTGSIPSTIGKVQRLSTLNLWTNNFSNTLPAEFYSLENLVYALMGYNKFSGSLSQSLMTNLKNLEVLTLNSNDLSGEVPNLDRLSRRLIILALNDNNFSGSFPNVVSSSRSKNIGYLALHNNEITGTVSSETCNIPSMSSNIVKEVHGYNFRGITTDCRNDILNPGVSCDCCWYCYNESPIWESECSDITIRIDIDHKDQDRKPHYSKSDDLVWSLVDNTSGNTVEYDGPYDKAAFSNTKESYKVCGASSSCYSFIMNHPPFADTNYTIYWNDESILKGTFKALSFYDYTSFSGDTQIMTSFYYDAIENNIVFDSVCPEKQITCFGESIFLDTKQRIMYNQAVKVSGSFKLGDAASIHSRALCWIVTNNTLYGETDNDSLESMFIQKYVLTLLHLMSAKPLFGDGEFPPDTHECDGWKGIECNDERVMTTLSLSSADFDGTLIDEVGSLAFLEVFQMSRSKLNGSIPKTFSNLYSLRELDLSSNSITGEIEDTFFDMLKYLEHLNLSNNEISGEIHSQIGSLSHIHTIQLSNNKFKGIFPLHAFTEFNLKKLDISENEFSGNVSSLLLKHNGLEYLNFGNNLMVGTLSEEIFLELPELTYFNVSNNELIKRIPPNVPLLSNMTHLDLQANKFTGTITSSIASMSKLKHLNLQGNKITGSIPLELNNLENIHTLVLSHNQLKGFIPLTFEMLPNMNILRLQANQLSGKAPISKKEMKEYITDCGYPAVSSNPIDCPSCSLCCNSENQCSEQVISVLQPTVIGTIFLFILIVSMTLIYKAKNKIIRKRSLSKMFEERVNNWSATDMIGDKSIYHFFLTSSSQGWIIALSCAICQLLTLFLYIRAANIANENSDLQYTIVCSKKSLDGCVDSKKLSVYGYIIFSLILGLWLLRDIVGSIKLLMLAMWKKNVDLFVASLVIFLVTMLSAWTSVFYNFAIATKNTELIVNAVILLFVNEIDERIYQLAETCSPNWVREIKASFERQSYYQHKDMMVTRLYHKVDKRVRSFGINRSASTQNDQNENDIVHEPVSLDHGHQKKNIRDESL